MYSTTINVSIPDNITMPNLDNYTPYEIFLIIQLGIDCLNAGQKTARNLSDDILTNKYETLYENKMKSLSQQLDIEKESAKKCQESIKELYESQLSNLQGKVEELVLSSNNINLHNKIIIDEKVSELKDKYELVYQEKYKQLNKLTEHYEKTNVSLNTKSLVNKGVEGEQMFEKYANTFKDFKGFKLIDKHTQGGQGDFHLLFDDFNVLADAKNYKKKVPVEQRDKIKKDLLNNKHINFGWLVSLNTSIDKFDRSPIMYEWINTNQCLIYINNLLNFNEPEHILRIVWFTCKELYKLIEDIDNEDIDIIKLKEQNLTILTKISSLRKGIREINNSINSTKNLIQNMDEELKDILSVNTQDLIQSNYIIFNEWWEKNIIIDNKSIISSTEIWTSFKQSNKDIIDKLDITVHKFKKYIQSKVPMTNIISKNKNINSAFKIKGIKLNLNVIDNNTNYQDKIIDNVELNL